MKEASMYYNLLLYDHVICNTRHFLLHSHVFIFGNDWGLHKTSSRVLKSKHIRSLYMQPSRCRVGTRHNNTPDPLPTFTHTPTPTFSLSIKVFSR